MALYPTCIRCFESESELDLDGLCTRCSIASKQSKSGQTKSPPDSTKKDPDPDATKTVLIDVMPSTLLVDVNDSKQSGGVQFRNYRNIEYIDRGGMGIVYKAIQEKTDRVVAIKTMSVQSDSDSRPSKRFLVEGQALARISHPGIVQIYEVSEDDRTRYFSMEYVPGGSLAKRLKNGPELSLTQSVEIIAQVASALAAAHSHNIIHRDIKPSNILLTEAGKPKLTDFGLAVFHQNADRMTNTGAVLGTPSYMSPEQASGRAHEVGPHSDVYSLGATLYELLTGQPPFTGENPVATAMKVVKDKPIPLRTLDPTIPAELETICLRCLEKSPRDRYPSAAELSNDLFRTLRQEPIGKPSLGYRFRKFTKTYRVVLIGIGLALLAAAAAIIAKPEHPKDKLARLIKAGKPFDLPLNSEGTPQYQAWPLSVPANIGKVADGVWGFKTESGGAFLELCPDSWTDDFEIRCDFRHMRAAHPTHSYLGFFFLRNAPPPDTERMQRLLQIRLRDAPFGMPNQRPVRHIYSTTTYAARGDDGKPELFNWKDNNGSDYAAALNELEQWRTLSVVVNRDGVSTTLTDAKTPERVLARMMSPAAVLRENPVNILTRPEIIKHGGQAAIPDWQPRCRFGVFADSSTVEFRNVRMIPHPSTPGE